MYVGGGEENALHGAREQDDQKNRTVVERVLDDKVDQEQTERLPAKALYQLPGAFPARTRCEVFQHDHGGDQTEGYGQHDSGHYDHKTQHDQDPGYDPGADDGAELPECRSVGLDDGDLLAQVPVAHRDRHGAAADSEQQQGEQQGYRGVEHCAGVRRTQGDPVGQEAAEVGQPLRDNHDAEKQGEVLDVQVDRPVEYRSEVHRFELGCAGTAGSLIHLRHRCTPVGSFYAVLFIIAEFRKISMNFPH